MPATTATIVLTNHDGPLFNTHLFYDGGGNLFSACSALPGSSTFIVITKTDPAGQVVGEWDVAPPANFKIDAADWTRHGAGLVVQMTCHELSGAPQRANIIARATLVGILTQP